jgi:DNA-binding HxlR family transcriptional regulator
VKLEKITNGRHYDDACAAAHALDLLGERWALLVVRELILGPRRFGDLRSSLSGISANVLTQRLEGLERAGIVRRYKLPPPASVQVYELTEWGTEAEGIVLALGRWAVRSPWHDPTLPLSAVGLMLSFRAKFEPARARRAHISLDFQLGEQTFAVVVRAGALHIQRASPGQGQALIAGEPSAVAALMYGKAALSGLERKGALKVSGEREALMRFAALFSMPPRAPAPTT